MTRIEIDISGALHGLDIADKEIESGLKRGIEKSSLYLEAKMAEKVSAGNIPPPLKETTIRRKGSSATLIDTGELLGQITTAFDIADKGLSAKVGVIGSKAEIARHHEFGAPGAGIPERSFIRTTYNREKRKVRDIIADEISKAI